MGIISKAIAAAAGCALLGGTANAACWSDTAYKAAQLRELDTMLMVEALRCRNTPANFVETYNQFVVASRPALLKANAALRSHFASRVGSEGALDAYDNYMTTVANRYGAGTEGLACADMASIVQAALAAGGMDPALDELVQAAHMVPAIPGVRCGAEPFAVSIVTR